MQHRRILTLALLSALGIAASLPAQTERFEEETRVMVVEVPIQVLDGDEPVRGLTRDDFEVLSRGTAHRIVGFDVIDLRQAAPARRPAESAQLRLAARRHFLLLFDLSFSDAASIVRAQQAAHRLTAEGLHPTDLVGVATYRASQGAELLLGFTTDRQQLALAIENLGAVETLRTSRDPLALVLGDPMESGSVLQGVEGFAGQKAQRYDAMLEMYRDLQHFQSRDQRDQRQNEVLRMASSLEQLARLMASVPGRKQVVFMSEGFDSAIITGSQDMRRLMEIAADAQSGEFWRVDNEERFGSTAAQSSLYKMLDEFKRADCVIQAVDISGISAGGDVAPTVSGEDGLFLLARETGGEFYRNYNDLSTAVDDLMERTSVTYLVAIQPDGLEWDGRYHPLKVRLKRDLKGARLIHRPGFYTPRPFAEQTAGERRINAAGLIMGGVEGGEIAASVLAAPFPGAGDEAYVPLILEIDGPALTASAAGERLLPIEVYAYAIDSQGRVRDYVTQSMRFELDKVGDLLRRAGLRLWASFDLPPDDYLVRVLVRNADSGELGLRMSSLRVPARHGEAELLPPLLPGPSGEWLLVQEPGAQRPDQPYPFLFEGRPFIPAARPDLRSRSEALVSLVGYNLGPGELAVETRLVTGGGEPAGSADLRLDPRSGVREDGVERLTGRLALGELATGEYRLEVTLRESGSGAEHSSSIPIRVVG